MPQVSIGAPVYNGERYLGKMLDSLLCQTFADFELVICDNASTDSTEQICRTYADRDSRIRYVRNPENVGVNQNFNNAFELSSGEYFRWASCDDLFAPRSLERCVQVLDREPSVVLVYPRTTLIDARGEVISEYDDHLNLQSPNAYERFAQVITQIGYVNVVYGLMRAVTVRNTGKIRNFRGGDIPFVAELALYGKFWEISEHLFYRRFHSGASSNIAESNVSEMQKFFSPKNKRQQLFNAWHDLLAHSRSVAHAPLTVLEKMRLCGYLVRMALWRRELLLRELSQTVRSVFHRHAGH